MLALSAAALATSAGVAAPRSAAAVAFPLPEPGAQLNVLRTKRFVQGDEDVWLANTRRFSEATGVKVVVESVTAEEMRAKGAMAANVGAGPDIVMGSSDMPRLYPDKCLDLTETATYLGQKYGGWYDVCRRYCMRDGRWIALTMAIITYCVVYRDSMIKAAGFSAIPRDLPGFLKLCEALKARGTPPGFALGNAIGDISWCSWLL